MSIALAAIVGDDLEQLERCVSSVLGLVDRAYFVSSHDHEAALAVAGDVVSKAGLLESVPLMAAFRPFDDYGTQRTAALELAASGRSDWLLMLDADMTVEWHEDLPAWLEEDHFPAVNGWQVTVLEQSIAYRLPLLTRRTAPQRYIGKTHEALQLAGRQAPLLGLTVTHHADGTHRADKLERDLELLRGGLVMFEPRAVYYSAQCYRDLGDTARAIELYRLRASLEGWPEETWHAAYQAAKLARDVPELLRVYELRPWRHEPLTAAAAIAREDDRNGLESLFVEL